MTSAYRKALVVVTVGGDHHPFDRLMTWVENWLVDEGERAHCIVQHGPAHAPLGAESRPFIDHQDLLDLMSEARAVVSSGGPATLSEARLLGHRPVTVPRLASLNEVVDDHQRGFTRRLHDLGLVVQVENEGDFRVALAAAIDAPRVMPSGGTRSESIARVGSLIDATAGGSPRSRRSGMPAARHRTPVGR
jgi:UDP-N-acetylglucosamine transferase subunit ALG13